MRALSASECAGLPLSTIMARKRFGWSVRISSGITLQGMSPPMMRAPVTGLRRSARSPSPLARAAASGAKARRRGTARPACRSCRSAAPAACAGSDTSVECRFICTPRSSKRGHARGARDAARDVAHELLVDAARRAVRRPPAARRSAAATSSRPVGVRGEPCAGEQVLLHQHGRPARRGATRRCRASRCRWMSASSAVSRAARVDDDERARRVLARSRAA